MADHDFLCHRLFSHPLMVEQLVRDFLPEAMAAGLDFAGLARFPAKSHAGTGQHRDGDIIWRLPLLEHCASNMRHGAPVFVGPSPGGRVRALGRGLNGR